MREKIHLSRRHAAILLPLLAVALVGMMVGFFGSSPATAAGGLDVNIVAGYNLVVDSNVLSPSTFAPSVATVMGQFCNTSGSPLSNVTAYIGNYGANTPGIYPSRATDSGGAFDTQHPHLAGTPGFYSFVHVGGQLGTSDATRYVGDIPAGECRVQYWHFSYPRRSNGSTSNDNSGNEPVWGLTRDPNDDLWLSFDIWASDASGAANDNASWTMTMRNEISAMANKIRPNPDGQWFNTESDVVRAGGLITSNGILYELGNIRQGFDNNGDFVPDYNAWMQPIGDPGYDPSCFRLIRTSGLLTVSRSSGQPDLVIPFNNQLYFTNIDPSNNGTRGLVYYTFQALGGPCSTALSPYQEVASGFENEKFNGDYGTGIPPVGSLAPEVTIDKSSNPETVNLGSTFTYQIPFANTSTTDGVGLGLSSGGGMPLMVSDEVPAGLEYVANSAAVAGSSGVGVSIRFSTDGGQTWSYTDPGVNVLSTVANPFVIQWWLNDTLPPSTAETATFQARVPNAYTGSPFIENCADVHLGDGASFGQACSITVVAGNNSVGDFVWQDNDNDAVQDPGEPGINGVAVSLYWDRTGNGLTADDTLMQTRDTAGSGGYLFGSLPDGHYVVVVDTTDPDIPDGYRITTVESYNVNLDAASATTTPVNFLEADFGFGPALTIAKQLTSANPAREGDLVTYTIDLTNNRPGDGTGGPTTCTYTYDVWTGSYINGTGTKAWASPQNILFAPDGQYATAPVANAEETITTGGYSIANQGGTISGLEIVLPIRVDSGTIAGDMNITLLRNGVATANSPYNYDLATLATGTLVVPVNPGDGPFNWSEFDGSTYTLFFEVKKQGNPPGDLDVDAVSLRISTEASCGTPDDTISPLPLIDTYDASKLEFVSASPIQTSVTTGGTTPYPNTGTLSWDDVGPLFPGQTRTVTVVFRALEQPGDATVPNTNCADSGGDLGATFLDGSPTNNTAEACATHNIIPTGSIGDTIWNDNGGPLSTGTASNGIQDGDEQGIPNVTVYLCSTSPCAAGNAIATTTTDANGNYLFNALSAGTYYVGVNTTSLPGTTFTQTGDPDSTCPGAGCDSQSSSTITPGDGNPANDDDLTRDFGYLVPNTIYGNIFEDNDNDATSPREPGENGFSNVTVYLCTSSPCNSGNASYTTQTNSNGDYTFSDLPNGTYYIGVNTGTLPAGATWTNTVDPEGAPGDSQSNAIPVSGGNVYGSYDFGYHRSGPLSLGDTVFVDWNADGVQNTGEEGIANVTVSLYQDDNGDGVIDPATDGLIATTTTNGSGFYQFTGLAPQNYIVVVDESTLPAGSYAQTADPDEGLVPCTICDGKGQRNLVANDDTVDFGYKPLGSGSIGDRVWRDDDGDGIQDAGEVGLANITVTLYHDLNGDGVYNPSEDALIASTSTSDGTDGNPIGFYQFTGLPAGDYLVDVDTADPQLPNDGNGDPYVLSTNNDPQPVNLSQGESYKDADFGFTTGGIIGDFVWQDNNGDGLQDLNNEPGINGVVINLYDCGVNAICESGGGDDVFVGTQTTANAPVTAIPGYYEFTGLPAGEYVVVVAASNFSPGNALENFTQTGDPDANSPAPPCTLSTCNNEAEVSLAAGQVDRSIDFGYQPPGIIGDFIYFDANGNGTPDTGEVGIRNVAVYLCTTSPCNSGNAVATTFTNSNGYYSFGNRPGGTYYVGVDTTTLPAGLTQTGDPDETGTCTTCDNQGTSNLPSGGSDLDQDFGYRYSGSYLVSGTVFFDVANDGGNYDNGNDVPYGGVTVYLWDSQGNLVATTTTDSNGFYQFPNLPGGGIQFTVSLNPNAPPVQELEQTKDPDTPGDCRPNSCANFVTVTINNADVTDQDFGFYEQVDCGDLPSPTYNTLAEEAGPCHVIGTLYLGSPGNPPDADAQGQPDIAAGSVANGTGDDGDGNDDEDGVNLVGSLVANAQVTLQVDVVGSNGYLVAWFDWNGDGDFSDAGEFLKVGSIPAGSNNLLVTVPSYYTGNNVYARFRLYEGEPSIIAPTGSVRNGEVEDYRFQGPTAISLQAISANALQPSPTLLLACALLLGTVSVLFLYRRRRQLATR